MRILQENVRVKHLPFSRMLEAKKFNNRRTNGQGQVYRAKEGRVAEYSATPYSHVLFFVSEGDGKATPV